MANASTKTKNKLKEASESKTIKPTAAELQSNANLAHEIAEDNASSVELRNLVLTFARELDSPYIKENAIRREEVNQRWVATANRLANT